MIKGVLQDVDSIFADHTDSTASTGNIALIPGPFTAAGSIFEVKVVGLGGLAAFPT